MILYGAGGHAKVVCSCLEDNNIEISGIFDDNPNCLGLETINNFGIYTFSKIPLEEIIISIGDNYLRKKVSDIIKHQFGSVIHPSAIVDFKVEIGKGTVIFHNSVVQRDTIIGNHVILNTSSSIDHDSIINDFAHIAPNATICGGVEIGTGTLIGAGAIVKPELIIGKWCTIGIGTIVLTNIPDYSIVIGNPGKIVKRDILP